MTALTAPLIGCGSASRDSPTAVSGESLYQRLVGAYIDYAGCARVHGMPNLPDPQVDNQGNDHYPSLDRLGHWYWPRSVLEGCAKVWERVHAIRDQLDSQQVGLQRRPITSRAQALSFARCIRAHGFPSFPDPNPGGSGNAGALPPGFAKTNPSTQASAAVDACLRRPSP